MAIGIPTAPSMMSPNFQDIHNLLQPSTGLSPEATSAIGIINQQRDYYAGLGASAAQGLSLARGQAGSSTEQFGVQQAINQANLSALNATGGILTQSMQNDLQKRLYLGQLTSDEIASLRNMQLGQQGLALQQQLGQAGINMGYANIDAASRLGQQQGRNELLGSGASLLAPLLWGRGFGGGGGQGMLTPGAGFLGGGGSTLTGSPYTLAGNPSSSLFPNGLGPVGTGNVGMFGPGGTLFNTAGTSGLGGGNLLPGVAGWQLGTHTFGDNRYSNIGGVAGSIGGSLFGPLGSAAGGFLGAGLGNAYGNLNNTAKALVNPFANPGATVKAVGSGINKIGDAVSHVFPF